MRLELVPNRGENPVARFGNDPGYARCSVNSRFWHGLLESHQCPIKACENEFTFDIKTMYSSEECECVAWDERVDIADCYCDFVIWTGDGKPQIATHEELCAGISCDLGVPCPTLPPSATPVDVGCDESVTYFLYRYVNKYGQPGPPSEPTEVKSVHQTAIIDVPASDDSCIEEVEIFASISGNKTGLEGNASNNSGFFSLGVFPIGPGIQVDLTNSGLELDSHDYFPPPEDLEGVLCHDFGLAGFDGKCVWYTVANQPHAWNRKKCLDHEVKALKYWNGALFAFTDSWIYRMNLVPGNGTYDFSAPFRYGERPFPLISDSRGVSMGQAGIFFPSVMGGVLVNDSQARVITTMFGKDDWLSLNPKTMQTAVFDYGVGMFTDQASYMYEWGDGTFGDLSGHLYQLPFSPDALYVDKNGILNYAIGSDWYKWDACYEPRDPCDDTPGITDCCCPYEWIGESIFFDTQARLTAGFIEFVPGTGDVNLEVVEIDCYDKPLFEMTFNASTEQCRKSRCFRKYFRMPICVVKDQIQIRLSGCGHVRRVVLGTSRSALRGNASG